MELLLVVVILGVVCGVESWPASLDDLVPAYLPDGAPTPPLGGAYGLDAGTHRVTYTP